MNKKIILCLFTFIVLTLFVFCSLKRNKITYSAPTQKQVNEFISKNSINALTIKEADDFSVVIFEKKAEYGHYVLYQDQNNKLYSAAVKSNGNSKQYPVLLGGVASGITPFVTVIINDEKMLKISKEIEITLADGTVVNEEISGKGTVVLCRNDKNEKPITQIKLVIYDKDRNILYEV